MLETIGVAGADRIDRAEIEAAKRCQVKCDACNRAAARRACQRAGASPRSWSSRVTVANSSAVTLVRSLRALTGAQSSADGVEEAHGFERIAFVAQVDVRGAAGAGEAGGPARQHPLVVVVPA